MTVKLAAWHVQTGMPPLRLAESTPQLERYLEDWLERDPGLIGDGIQIVGRQVHLVSGRLDLLGLDVRGRWLAIEIKPGFLYREVIAQVLDYVAALESMTTDAMRAVLSPSLPEDVRRRVEEVLSDEREDEEPRRDVVAVVVGTGTDAGLDRLREYLVGRHSVPIQVITLYYFAAADGSAMLVREATEPPPPPRESDRYERVRRLAEEHGVLKHIETVIQRSNDLGLYPRPYVRSIMPTPPDKRNRGLFAVSVRSGAVDVWHDPETIAELTPGVEASEAAAALGARGWRRVSELADVVNFMNQYATLQAIGQQRAGGSDAKSSAVQAQADAS